MCVKFAVIVYTCVSKVCGNSGVYVGEVCGKCKCVCACVCACIVVFIILLFKTPAVRNTS